MPSSDLAYRLRDDFDAAAGKISLSEVRLNAGGYDNCGFYWGAGERLFSVTDHNGTSHHLRARDRDAAKMTIRQHLPDARFYR